MRSAGLRGRATAIGITLAALSLTVTSLASCTGQARPNSSEPAQPNEPAKQPHRGSRVRHRQDPARGDHHAGEPVVRLVLRHLSRCRRHPRQQRPVHRVRTRPAHQRLRQAVPRPEPGERRRRPQHGRSDRRHRRRQDGRVRPDRRGPAQPGLQRHQPADAGVPARQPAGRDGLPRRPGDPELLDLRPGLRPAGSHVRAGRLLVPALPPVPGQRLVGALRQHEPGQLRERPGAGRGRGRRSSSRTSRPPSAPAWPPTASPRSPAPASPTRRSSRRPRPAWATSPPPSASSCSAPAARTWPSGSTPGRT